MTILRAGVIGVGYLGRYHAEKYAAHPGVQLVGVADIDAGAAEAVARRLSTTAYTDYRSLLGQVDLVSVVVPTPLHHRVGRDCLAAGVHLLLEKPMTTTLEEADDLIDLADRRGLVLQVGHLERFNPAVVAMREHLTQPLFIESHRIHVFKPRGVDVDVVLDLMIHDIDIIHWIAGSPIASLHTVGVPVVTGTTDIANARIIFANGCTANVTVSRVSRDNIRRIRVFQPGSFVSVDYAKREITVIRMAGGLDANGMPAQDVVHKTYEDGDALALEIDDFITNCRTGRRPQVSGVEGRQALATASEIMAQIRSHARRFAHLLPQEPYADEEHG